MLTASLGVQAQDGNSPVRYSNLALQFSQVNANGDPQAAILPSVALSNGFGGYVDNPASIALIKGSYTNFALLNSRLTQESIYLGNTYEEKGIKNYLGNIGGVYKVPTKKGSMVIGGGYNLHTNLQRNTQIAGRNNESTITDHFKDPSSDYYDLAFETYAIDYGDVDSTYLESIFRIGFGPGGYPGITQDADISYRSRIGEYAAFFGTEFQKNLYFGLSGGIISGSYTYTRNFLEMDEYNQYDGNFIPSDQSDEGTDIDHILTHDEIDADITGLSLRAGLIYSFNNRFNLGVSYTFPSVLEVQEKYYSSIETNLDDNSTPFFYDLEGSFNYSIRRPGQINVGFALQNMNGFSFSSSAEYIDYSTTDLDFTVDRNSYGQNYELKIQENVLDSLMAADYKEVVNLKAGVKYLVNNKMELRAGAQFLPGKSKVYEASREVYSLGLGVKLSSEVVLDLSGQYRVWDDRSVAYSYTDNISGQPMKETISQKVSQLRFQAGIKLLF